MTGIIFDIKEMAVHDGPGIRTTVFLKGCPLRCVWCHNPEGLSPKPQLMYKKASCIGCAQCMKKCEHEDCKAFGRCIHSCPENCLEVTGKYVDSKELADELKRQAEILGDSFGGFTFSGGEPLAQPAFLFALLEELKEYHLCVETCGYADADVFQKMIEKLDFVIMDIKIADSQRHRAYTGVPNEKILENFSLLKSSKKPYTVRTPQIPGITDTKENLDAIQKIIGDSRWERLPFNEMAGAKYEMLGLDYKMQNEK